MAGAFVMTANPINWFEIYVGNMDRAKAFYEGVLGAKLKPMHDPGPGISEMCGFPGEPGAVGATGALVRMEGGPQGPGGVLVYFSCDDCAVECARVPKRGGTIKKQKFSIGQYGFIALITDTEGNMVGLHSMT